MTNLSLCSGSGRLDLAVEQITGNKTQVCAESDPFAAQVMAAHWPHAENLGDITVADWWAVAERYRIESLSAGFPCQGISSAGLRLGLKDPRTALWRNVAEAIRVTRPRLAFLENVDAIRTRDKGQVFGTVLADLAAIGYDARWTCLPARDIGAPHTRWRWFCIAHPVAEDTDIAAWCERWAAAPGQAEGCGTRPDAGGRGGFPASAASSLSLLPTPVVADSRSTANFRPDGTPYGSGYGMTLTDAIRLLPTPSARGWKSGASNLLGTNSRPLDEVVANLLPTPKASDGPNGGPDQRDASGNYYLPTMAVRLDDRWVATDGTDYGPAIRRWEAVTGRPAPCPTEPGARGNRRLAPPFVEWLMGCEEGWVTSLGLPRAEQLKILGNGVVTRQAIEGYRRLLTADLEAMAS